MPRLFAISDLHLDEDTTRAVRRGRSVATWMDHRARIEQNWRRLVTEADTVIVAGDVASSDLVMHLTWLDALPGRKLFVPGNHDPIPRVAPFQAALKRDALRIELVHPQRPAVVGDVVVAGVCGVNERSALHARATDADRRAVRHALHDLETALALVASQTAGRLVVVTHYPPGPLAQTVIAPFHPIAIIYGHLHGASSAKAALPRVVNGAITRCVSTDFGPTPHTPTLITELGPAEPVAA